MIIGDEEYRGELLFPELERLRLLYQPTSVPSETTVDIGEGAARLVYEWETEIVDDETVPVFVIPDGA